MNKDHGKKKTVNHSHTMRMSSVHELRLGNKRDEHICEAYYEAKTNISDEDQISAKFVPHIIFHS